MKIRPLQGQVLIRMDPQESVTNGGIIIPEKYQDKALLGRVIKHGIWRQFKDGSLRSFPIKKGDRVIVNKRRGRWIHSERQRLKIVDQDDILAICEKASASTP